MELKNITIYKEIVSIVGKQNALTDDLSLIAYSADAGCYRKIPKLIVKPENEQQVIQLLKLLHATKTAVTFRAAGTSLSGQSISNSILMQARGDKWSKVTVHNNGETVTSQIGITGGRLNQILKPYKVKFGPDPASINSALIGGIISNNASGMSCGIYANSYATIQSARIIFNDGTVLDTADSDSIAKFIQDKPNLIQSIKDIRDKIVRQSEWVKQINDKYTIKNTTGYGLNAFIDYTDPIDIILHLMVGSEGTLGFISQATFKTVPELPFRASAMIYFESLKDACNAVPKLKSANVSAIELLDREALRSVENKPGIPEYIKEFPKGVTALLIDLESTSKSALDLLMGNVQQALSTFTLVHSYELTQNPKQIAEYWKIRKGVFPSVGGMRPPGTSIIIEDIAVKMQHLTPAVLDLRQKLDELGYDKAVIYGHALDGNLHFIFSQNFNDPNELVQYKNMLEQVCTLIVKKYNGSLKAEHGTGLNMAPFVQFEWGPDLYAIMREIKQIFDKDHLLNPDVIITDDPDLHLKNFKPVPLVDESVDQCIECGFCEINCLSTGYTLSARQRIVVQRELHRLKNENSSPSIIKKITDDFQFMGNESCAGDGLCATSCPLSIDTGVLIKKLRDQQNSTNASAQKWALRIANNFDTTTKLVRAGLSTVSVAHSLLGTRLMQGLASGARAASFKNIPEWTPYMPMSANSSTLIPRIQPEKNLKVVYFPSCINQTMGPAKGDADKKTLMQVTLDVLNRAGYQVIFPDNMEHLCCGTPWESKGFINVANKKSDELEAALLKASKNGAYPILCDTSPCIYRMKKVMNKVLKLYEPVEFAHDFLLDKLSFTKTNERVAFHVTCSSTKMDITDKFIKVAQACTTQAVFPQEVGCCGFAGDKGFSQPDLNNWALRKLKPQLSGCSSGYSNSRTCEIGLSKNSGIHYKSVMYLIEKATS